MGPKPPVGTSGTLGTLGTLGALGALAACARPAASPASAPAPAAAPRRSPATPLEGGATAADASHLLARLTFGARPGEARTVAAAGLARWLDRQLHPARIEDAAGVAALAPFAAALAGPEELRAAEAEAMGGGDAGPKRARKMARREGVLEAEMTAVARHVASERQLLEVMVDFWTNHFSVSLQKGRVRYLAADFVERAVRPHALGRFGDLLEATARHPAMLLYLDNAQSVAPRPGSRQALRGRGLNENYARELLELHTVGVAARYTQEDVIAVARILSGWSVAGDEFVFRWRMHDDGEKTAMGRVFPAGGGQGEGVALLAHLAAHPATIDHVCRRLCGRLVADDPPAAVVAAAAAAWRATGGEMAAVVRAIAGAPGFWDPAVRGAKLKSPLELVVSAVRAVGGEVDGIGLARMLNRLGQPPLLAPAPTGYADTRDAWLSTAGALDRMDFALALAAGRVPGVRVAIDRILGDPAAGVTALLDRLDAMVAGGLTPATREVIARWLVRAPSRAQAGRLALALTIASPEFQHQ
ncbi:MAG TPA: DUF1800 domain-containing protein [Kofleriaceae bacterium]|nr:DUF1800 domain-containing protein [Kofleriaceae bacterium]